MAERFYVNCELRPGPVLVQGAEAHHLAVVCRLRPGDAVCLFNGDGHQYPARIEAINRREVALDVFAVESPSRELPFRLDVAAPLPRGDRAQFLLEKLTELGVTSFTPLRTARSVVHPRETKLDKLQRYVIEASKQCGRNVLLEVRPLIEWPAFCAAAELPPRRILAHPGGDAVGEGWRVEGKPSLPPPSTLHPPPFWRSGRRADSRRPRSHWRVLRAGICWIWGRASCASRQRRWRWQCFSDDGISKSSFADTALIAAQPHGEAVAIDDEVPASAGRPTTASQLHRHFAVDDGCVQTAAGFLDVHVTARV
jgi:16S rRNA (uracil1498-N3)-methyltransferase